MPEEVHEISIIWGKTSL